MAIDGPQNEQRGFAPNPLETVPPPTSLDAFQDGLRYLGTIMPAADVRKFVEKMDTASLVHVVNGTMLRPLNPVEKWLGTTVEYCMTQGLLGPRDRLRVVAEIESARQDFLNGGIVRRDPIS